MNDIRRGEIFYIDGWVSSTHGNEQYPNRPAVVVSNDKNNKNSGVIEVVYLTTQPKTNLPTHVVIKSSGKPSTVLCEQVCSVSIERFGRYVGQCSDEEMQNINRALAISLQLDENVKTSKKYIETIEKQEEEIKALLKKLSTMETTTTDPAQTAPVVSLEALIRAETERDTYRTLYERLFSKLTSA